MEDSNSSEHEDDPGSDRDFEALSTNREACCMQGTVNSSGSGSESIIPLELGAEYISFRQLEASISDHQKNINSVYYKRDCITIAKARKRRDRSRPINDDLKYYWLKYCCIHGGKRFKSTSRGIRSVQTFQKQCSASFCLIASQDAKKLVVTQINNEHNHLCTKQLFDHLPQIRGMTTDEKNTAKEFLSMGANKKLIKHKCVNDFGKQVILKDLSNIMASQESGNNLQNTVEKLKKVFGAESHVFEEDGVMKGLFFFTKQMQQAMDSYPEFVGIDGTFKLLNIRAPIYLMIVQDSEGNTEIVAVCILIHEDTESMRWFLRTFKKVHPSWTKIRSDMADKDLLERQVIKQEFESANVVICIFHSLRTFNREISCQKMTITPEERDEAKRLFQKMLYSSTEAEYMRHYEKCKELPSVILDYFMKNWHHIRNEWTSSKDFMQHTFMNTTNNRVESLNAKIKSVVKLYSSLEDFVGKFFVLVACLYFERDYKAAYNYQKILVLPFEKDDAESLYCNHLTRFAFDFVKKELTSFRRGKLIVARDNGEILEFQDGGSRFQASLNSCTYLLRKKNWATIFSTVRSATNGGRGSIFAKHIEFLPVRSWEMKFLWQRRFLRMFRSPESHLKINVIDWFVILHIS